jgi:hypothetical protein
MPPFDLTIALVGCFGGLLPDVLRLIKNKYKATLPAYLKRSPFWIGLILQVLLGGLMAWLLGAEKASYALVFGYAAPQFVTQLVAGVVAQKPPVDRGVPTAESKARERPMTAVDWLAS